MCSTVTSQANACCVLMVCYWTTVVQVYRGESEEMLSKVLFGGDVARVSLENCANFASLDTSPACNLRNLV